MSSIYNGTSSVPKIPEKVLDLTVRHPPHYKASGMEAIDVIEAFAPGNYHRGNALKYLLRAGKKGPAQVDLHKAIWYIRREIDHLELAEWQWPPVDSVPAQE